MAEGNFGYGQQDPSDSTHEFNARDFHIDQSLAQIRTVTLVKVLDVDTAKQTVDVQIMVNQVDGQANATPHGKISGISYAFAQNGGNAVIMDPVVGDKGVMAVCDRDISAVRSTKDIANPGSFRKFSASDGIYLFGLPSINDAPTQWIKFLTTGVQITDKNGNVIETKPGEIDFTTPLLKVSGAIQAGGAVTAGFGSADQVGLQTHRHNSGANTPPTPGT